MLRRDAEASINESENREIDASRSVSSSQADSMLSISAGLNGYHVMLLIPRIRLSTLQ